MFRWQRNHQSRSVVVAVLDERWTIWGMRGRIAKSIRQSVLDCESVPVNLLIDSLIGMPMTDVLME
jgi:hypothetical protein